MKLLTFFWKKNTICYAFFCNRFLEIKIYVEKKNKTTEYGENAAKKRKGI